MVVSHTQPVPTLPGELLPLLPRQAWEPLVQQRHLGGLG
jgi:hypothetical protein